MVTGTRREVRLTSPKQNCRCSWQQKTPPHKTKMVNSLVDYLLANASHVQHTLELSICFRAFHGMCDVQQAKKHLLYEDIDQIVQHILLANNVHINELTLNALSEVYAIILFQATTTPLHGHRSDTTSPLLQVTGNLIGQDHEFVNAIMTLLRAYCAENGIPSGQHAVLQNLEYEVSSYFYEQAKAKYRRQVPHQAPYSEAGSVYLPQSRPVQDHGQSYAASSYQQNRLNQPWSQGDRHFNPNNRSQYHFHQHQQQQYHSPTVSHPSYSNAENLIDRKYQSQSPSPFVNQHNSTAQNPFHAPYNTDRQTFHVPMQRAPYNAATYVHGFARPGPHQYDMPNPTGYTANSAAPIISTGSSGGKRPPKERIHPILFKVVLQLRAYNMDVIFPQPLHDKVLACLFAALKAIQRPVVHRELIHLAMTLKDCGLMQGLEHVSKTKIRGVLAVLKQAEMVKKFGAAGDAVQLYLSEEINSFAMLRDRHDAFLLAYMMENRMSLPEQMHGEVVWLVGGELRQRRTEMLEGLVQQLMPMAVEAVMGMGDQLFQQEALLGGGKEDDGKGIPYCNAGGDKSRKGAYNYGAEEYSLSSAEKTISQNWDSFESTYCQSISTKSNSSPYYPEMNLSSIETPTTFAPICNDKRVTEEQSTSVVTKFIGQPDGMNIGSVLHELVDDFDHEEEKLSW